eukprot:CAMPEP_0113952958 /NCGR_PEP_ID=MMETSP1339-20121228/90713_1 /TAXON_ID=94617 /ORGANISM="Fibrocapsa japonica" /LENGTH=116 /DNA_ID=CAMNT_0000961641 /DNA_START=833 /DNA_END=1184 /DNA_ORIENTATION=- /assembly_acc=CAM_ASM_000762
MCPIMVSCQMTFFMMMLKLIDGIWAESKQIVIQSPELIDMYKQVQLVADYQSIYDGMRKEPEKHCTSTLEACAHALMLLEPNKKCAIEAKSFLEGTMRNMVQKINIWIRAITAAVY